MRAVALILFTLFTGALLAQTPVNRTYPVNAGQKISLRFDYPELVKITTWDKNEIAIVGSVSINSGESDDAFELIQSTSGNTIYIENVIRNLKSLPKRITVTRGGEKLVFKSEDDYRKYYKETGSDFNVKSWGVDMDILLEVKVPKNIETKLECVYGIAEVKNFFGPLTVEATYGGIDVSVQETTTGELRAETNYGQIYSNLDLKFTGSEFKDFHTVVSAKPGAGSRYSFESKYGNVYLRKAM
jgi:copper chaperone CopZ